MKELLPMRRPLPVWRASILLVAGPVRVPVEGVVAIGLLAAVAVVAAAAERRRRRASEDQAATDAPEPAPPLDEDTIGTIEYAPPTATVDDPAHLDRGEPA